MRTMDARPPLHPADIGALRDAVARVAEAPESAPAPADTVASVTVGVSGGAPSQRYELVVSLNGTGEARYRFLDEMRQQRERRDEQFFVSPEETARIFGLLDRFVTPPPRELYTPDSLVGFVTVRAGRLEAQTRFPVREARGGVTPESAVRLGATDEALHVEPGKIAEGFTPVLTRLFGAMSSLVESRAATA